MSGDHPQSLPLFTVAALFCDDIRFEQSGQISLIGHYQGVVSVERFPVEMTRLFVYVRVRIPVAQVPKSELSLSLRASFDETLHEFVDLTDVITRKPNGTADDPDASGGKIAFDGAAHFTVEELNVPKAGDLSILLHVDGTAYEVDRLKIRATEGSG